VTLRARWVTLRARWVTLRARWVTLRARWVTLRARWVTLTAQWEIIATSAELGRNHEDVGVMFRLTDSEYTRAMWDYPFELTYEVLLGNKELTCKLTVSNPGSEPFPFTAALHPYIATLTPTPSEPDPKVNVVVRAASLLASLVRRQARQSWRNSTPACARDAARAERVTRPPIGVRTPPGPTPTADVNDATVNDATELCSC
jgi:hypothetical protein